MDYLLSISKYHPAIQVLHFCLMPDHLHSVWYVRETMPTGILQVVRGFWQATKRLGRAVGTLPSSITPKIALGNNRALAAKNAIRENLQEEKGQLMSIADALRKQLGDNVYYSLSPIFTEIPFVRPMGQRRQLPATIRYIDMNPQRRAAKHFMPDFFCVQDGIEIAGRVYSGVGNIELLQSQCYSPVHVRSMWVADAEQHGYDQPLRDYMNGCVLAARQGAIMVSPFISKQEQAVMEVLLKEKHPFIYIADNGFRDYYKPQDSLFDAVADKRALILSPWKYDADKKHVSRADCVAMNKMVEDICNVLTSNLA